MLTIRNLESGYGQLRVLKNISLHVRSGEIVAIIGANGAGKTTLVHVVAGLLKPWRGDLFFQEEDITRTPVEIMAALGCVLVPEGRQVFASMSVEDNLLLGGSILRKRNGTAALRSQMEQQYARFPVLQARRSQPAWLHSLCERFSPLLPSSVPKATPCCLLNKTPGQRWTLPTVVMYWKPARSLCRARLRNFWPTTMCNGPIWAENR